MSATYTYAPVPMSREAYQELNKFFTDLGPNYAHVFIKRPDVQGDSAYPHINMHGYAVVYDPSRDVKKTDHAAALAEQLKSLIECKPPGHLPTGVWKAWRDAETVLANYNNRRKGE